MNNENRECIVSDKYSDNYIKKCSKLKLVSGNNLNKIGEGGFGVVYDINAIINGKNKELVLKVIKQKLKKDTIKNFYYEVEYSEKMGDLGIGPKIYDAFYSINNNYIEQNIIMEKFDMSVDKWIKSDIFPRGSKYIISHMLKLLKLQIFEKNMFCSDIKPQNYVVRFKPMSVKMIDFGTDWCGTQIPGIYITSPSLRVYNKNMHREIFYSLCLIQLFIFILHSFNSSKKALHALVYFYSDKLFIDYIVNKGAGRGVNIKLIFYDVLETDIEHAAIIRHYLDFYGDDNESIIKGSFRDIDRITSMLYGKH